MKLPVLLPVVLCLLVSCSDEATSQQMNFARSNTWASWRTPSIEEPLKLRLSILAPSATMRNLVGTLEPYAIGLTVSENITSKNNNYYIESDKFIRFSAGKLKGSLADLIEYNSKKAVGTVSYYDLPKSYPGNPNVVKELCTGPFEKVCTISYDEPTKMFSIKVHDEAPTLEPEP